MSGVICCQYILQHNVSTGYGERLTGAFCVFCSYYVALRVRESDVGINVNFSCKYVKMCPLSCMKMLLYALRELP